MNSLQRWGGIGAIVFGSINVGIFVLTGVLYGAQGVSGQTDLYNADKMVPFYNYNTVWMAILSVAALLRLAGLLLLVFVLSEKLRANRASEVWSVRIAAALGLSSFTLLLASAAITLFSMQGVSDLYATDKSGASILLRALTLVSNYLGSIRVVAFGVAVIIFSWVALQMLAFPRFLNWLGVVSGILTFGFLITPLAVVGYLSYFLIAIWAIWLGVVFLFEPVSARAEAPAPAT